MNAFGKWIERVGLRPTDVATALGITRGAVSKMSRDNYWPKRDVAITIRRFTGGQVSLDDLLGDVDSPAETDEHREMLAALRRTIERNHYGPSPQRSRKRRPPEIAKAQE